MSEENINDTTIAEMQVKLDTVMKMNEQLLNMQSVQPAPVAPQRVEVPDVWDTMGMTKEAWEGCSPETQGFMSHTKASNDALRGELANALTSGLKEIRNEMNPQSDVIKEKMAELHKKENFKNFSQDALRLLAQDILEEEQETNQEENDTAYPGGPGTRGIPTPKTKVKLTKDSPEGKELYATFMEATGDDNNEADVLFAFRQSLVNGDK